MAIEAPAQDSSAGLEWQEIAKRLADVRTLWLATVTPDGAPHSAPVWSAIHADALHIFTSRRSAKARNIAHDPRGLLHLENGEDVLIVHGRFSDSGSPDALPEITRAFASKYTQPGDSEYLPGVDPSVDVIYTLEPTAALAWDLATFDTSQRRWHS